ncbi:alpha/beta fold hydrolase [Corynebacterium pilosum]|uniref:Hydrolase n=1 Tax=Corynebacterium pilosum TaxID=35756 RepID=A0A376CRD5_9CORY|nr:alpha/beta fold hydrolase [Corynebacterium pilosum]STC70198.1 hydrolase [Corynebacterium pilosum]
MRKPTNILKKSFARFGAVAATAALTVGVCATPANAAPDPLAPTIAWEDCPAEVNVADAQCGRIDVPRDYADPTGPTISLGFVLNPADNPGARRGTLFTNPGGPGGNAYAFAANTEIVDLPAGITDEWDVIGVQPRGLDGSTPISCNEYQGAPQDLVDNFVAPGALFQRACDTSDPGYTRTFTTSNNAEDWEMVRRALGENTISILGLSYGTYLGSVYATRYPQRVDKLVLDSAMNPYIMWNELILGQRSAMQRSIYEFFGYAAVNNDQYGLGDTPLKVYNNWAKKVLAESGTTPTLVPPPAQTGDLPADIAWAGQAGADAMTALGAPASQVESLKNTVVNGAQQGEAASPTLQATVASMATPMQWHDLALHIAGIAPIEELLPGAAQRQLEELSPEELDEVVSQQLHAAFYMTLATCNENVTPPNLALLPEYVWGTYVMKNSRIPYNLGYGAGVTCNGVAPVRGVEHLDGSQLRTRPLQISGTLDSQTVYSQRHGLADAMGAHILTVHGPGHGHTGFGNHAVDNIVVDYLRTGNPGPTDAPGYFEQ